MANYKNYQTLLHKFISSNIEQTVHDSPPAHFEVDVDGGKVVVVTASGSIEEPLQKVVDKLNSTDAALLRNHL